MIQDGQSFKKIKALQKKENKARTPLSPVWLRQPPYTGVRPSAAVIDRRLVAAPASIQWIASIPFLHVESGSCVRRTSPVPSTISSTLKTALGRAGL
jgi:hypothetical protein